MTFSPEQYQDNIGKNEALPKRTRAYFQQRFQQQVFARLAKAFAERAEALGITKSVVATLAGKDKSQVNRILSHPSNLTLDTLSELALALNFEPVICFEDLSMPVLHNYTHKDYLDTDGSWAHVDFDKPTPPKVRMTPSPNWHLEGAA